MRRLWASGFSSQRPKKIFIITALIASAVIFLQFLYPWNRTLPNARVGELPLGMLSHQEAKDELTNTYGNWQRTVKTVDRSYTVAATEAGVTLNAEATVRGPLTYQWWQRLIPGSFVAALVNGSAQPVVDPEPVKITEFSNKIREENYVNYTNATVVVEGEQASVKPEQDGQNYSAESVTNQLVGQFYLADGDLYLEREILRPVIKSVNAEIALRDAEKLISAPPKYVIGDKNGEVAKATFGSWLVFNQNEDRRRLDITLSRDQIHQFLYSLYPYIYGDAKLPGDSSNAVSVDSAVEGFGKTLEQKGTQITATVAQIALTPELKAKRSYGPSQLGLQALVSDLAAEKGDYAIAVQELSGRGWSAVAGGDKKYTPASTYKLFVAYSVLKKIETGEWSWGGSIIGTSIERCFDVMIINSDNACAEAFGNTIGWKNVETQMRELGLKDTVLNSGAFVSTANDELIFMSKLGRGEILGQSSRDKLIDVMKRQVYRRGIPAGTGLPVADKVGFLYALLHDAALVYAPQGTYALVILTDDSTWGNIADVAAKIQAHLAG